MKYQIFRQVICPTQGRPPSRKEMSHALRAIADQLDRPFEATGETVQSISYDWDVEFITFQEVNHYSLIIEQVLP